MKRNASEVLNDLLYSLEPIKYMTVNDLPDVPDKNTIYALQQEWVYIDDTWIRIDGGINDNTIATA